MKLFLKIFILIFQISIWDKAWAEAPDLVPETQVSEPTVEAVVPKAATDTTYRQGPEQAQAEEKDSSPFLSKPLNIKAGASLQHYRYEEPGLISHTGVLIGAWLNWNYAVPFYQGAIQSEINTGRIDYNGALCDVNTSVCVDYKSKTTDMIVRISHRLGIDVTENFQVFAGLGYRYLYDKGEGVGFYRRIGNYWLLPLGFTSSVMWKGLNTKVIFDFEYDYFLFGQMQSRLSDVNSTYSDVNHPQNRGRAQRLTVGFEPVPDVDTRRPWIFYFFYENWAIPQSDRAELLINGTHSGKFFYEPENSSNAYGLRVGWSY